MAVTTPAFSKVYSFLSQKFGLKSAILVDRLIFWSNNPKYNKIINGKVSLPIPYRVMKKMFPADISIRTLKNIVKILESNNILIPSVDNSRRYDRTKSYVVNYDVLNAMSREHGDSSSRPRINSDGAKIAPPIIREYILNNHNHITRSSIEKKVTELPENGNGLLKEKLRAIGVAPRDISKWIYEHGPDKIESLYKEVMDDETVINAGGVIRYRLNNFGNRDVFKRKEPPRRNPGACANYRSAEETKALISSWDSHLNKTGSSTRRDSAIKDINHILSSIVQQRASNEVLMRR